jgi:tetratricopeptide (TPR) repeat protein
VVERSLRIASPLAAAAGVLVAGAFVARAVPGVPAAWAQRQGRILEAKKEYLAAIPLIDRGDVFVDRADSLWRSARARVKYWYTLPEADRNGPRGDETLREAARYFLRARVSAPAASWLTGALGYVYICREKVSRSHRTLNLAELEGGPWHLVGDDGRIAIGLSRAAIVGEPNGFESYDELVFLLESYGLREEAMRAIAEAAQVLPEFDAHDEFGFDTLPRELIEAFWRASRALGAADAPFQLRERHLLSLGLLGRQLGHFAEAEADLRAALKAPGTSLAHAEDAFHLAQVLIDVGRLDEAEAFLAVAAREPVFGPGVAESRARIAVLQERWPDALEQLRDARRFNPRDVPLLLQFSAIAQKAGEWNEAHEALRWAILVHPEDPAPRRATVELFLAEGERERAKGALDEYVVSFGRTEDAVRLEQAVAEPLDPPGR